MLESSIVGIVGWFAGSSISTGLGKIRSIWEDHQELQDSAAQMLRELVLAVNLVRLLLNEANHKMTAANTDFKPCLVEMKGYVSEAEDLIDEFEVKKILKNSKVSDKLAIDDKNIKKLKAVLENLNVSASKLKDFLGMLKSHSNEKEMIGLLPYLPPNNKLVHGRDAEIQRLLDIVLHNKSNSVYPPESTIQEEEGRACMDHPRLILIQGTAGVGKTTLAQVIYNHRFVKEAFGMRGWVFVHKCAVGSICEGAIRSFKAEHQPFDSQMSLPLLQTSSHSSGGDLASILENKRFLLVFDDVQDNFHNIWADLSHTLTKGAPGSIVLVTTRSDDVVERMGIETHCCISLQSLPQFTLWTILKDNTLEEQENSTLKSIGQKIAHNLHGLPLLAELIGRLLRQKLNEEHWRKVSESTWWIYSVDLDNPAFPSVKIICEYLTVPLKECLYYCSIFPYGYLFEKNKLMHMWMANFAYQEGVESMKEKIFNELCNMSFLESMHWENKYVMRDLLRKQTAHVYRDELYHATERDRGKRILDSHQVIDISNFDVRFDSSKASKLRSMVITASYRTNRNDKLARVLSHSSNLRVLDLSNIRMEPISCPSGDLQEFKSSIETESISPPDVIHTFEHLRFLDLSYTKITKIPESFCKLYLLQVLGLRGCYFKSLPTRMNQLIHLRYLYAEACTLSLIDQIGKLTNLQELEEFVVSERNRMVELRNLNQLGGQLCIANLDKVSQTADAAEAELCRKIHLRRLVLKWENPISSDSDDCMSILEGLEPPKEIKELKIQGYGGFIFPKWAGMGQDYKYLHSIHVCHCEKLECLPPLGLLPALKILLLISLPSIKQINNAFYGDKKTVFKSLKELTFHSMLAWEKWSEIESWQSIPQLKKIRIDNCPNLKEVPLHDFRETLMELVLSDCGSILASKRCLEGFIKLEHLKVCKYSGSITLPCHSLTSLVVLNVSNDGSKIDFSGGTERLPNLRWLVINGDVQVISDKTKPVMQPNMSSVSTVEMPFIAFPAAPMTPAAESFSFHSATTSPQVTSPF